MNRTKLQRFRMVGNRARVISAIILLSTLPGSGYGQANETVGDARQRARSIFEGEYMLGEFTGQATVIHGAEIIVNKRRLPLDSIRAPYRKQYCYQQSERIPCGEHAAKELELSIAGRPVRCELRRRKLGGKLNATCYNVRGDNLSKIMVKRGWAFPTGPRAREFRPELIDARIHSTGIWGMEFVFPWDWKRGFRVIDPPARGAGFCTIKGNVEANGTQLYYRPYQAGYHRVKIDREKHERWFCNDKEAEKAGWKKAPP